MIIPKISICIPTYKRANDLKRLLDSIAIQSFRDFEVIVTDDTPDDSVSQLCGMYQNQFSIHYYRNQQQLNTPENWNESIRKASGEWVKLMHDDDWFASKNSLKIFYDESRDHPDCSLIFCAYRNFRSGKLIYEQTLTKVQERLLKNDPENLIYKNLIGPPSVVMHKNKSTIIYDNKMKWMVDVDYYIRFLKLNRHYKYLPQFLVNIGLHESQVTQQVIKDPKVVIPENFRLLNKLDISIFDKIRNFDYVWRLVRNYDIRSEQDAVQLLKLNPITDDVPAPVLKMITAQRNIPASLLRMGVISKMAMAYSYFFYRIKAH